MKDVQETIFPHAHSWLGAPVGCCGVWHVYRERGRACVRCSECGEERPVLIPAPMFAKDIALWPGLAAVIPGDTVGVVSDGD